MLRPRSSIWILAIIVGSVLTQDVGVTDNQLSEKQIDGNFSRTDNVSEAELPTSTITPVEISKEIQLQNTTPLIVSEPEIVTSNSSSLNDPVKESATLSPKAVETKTNKIQREGTSLEKESKPEKSNPRKGTIQFVVNAPTTRHPPHYYTTPYTHPTHRPTPPYYPYPPYPPYPYPPYPTQAPTTSRPWPPFGGYPDYPGYFPGYGYRPPFGYPGYIYGPYGYPWYHHHHHYHNNTNEERGASGIDIISTFDQDIGKPIRNPQTPIKSMPFLSFLNFGKRKK